MTALTQNKYSGKHTAAHTMKLLHALAITCFILVYHFYPASFGLSAVKNLYFSEATANGIDVGMRVGLLYQCCLWGLLLTLTFYFLFRFIERRTSFKFQACAELMLFSIPIICLGFIHVMGIQTMTVLKMLHALFWIRLFILLLTPKLPAVAILKQQHIFGLCLIFAFFILFTLLFLLGQHEAVRDRIATIYTSLVILLAILYVIVCYRLKRPSGQVFSLLLPLSSVSLLAFLSLEILFYIKQFHGYFIRYKLLFSVALLCVALAVWFVLWLRRRKNISTDKVLLKWVGPMLILTLVMLAGYVPVMRQQTELFEFANSANSIMNVFRFGKIPMLDFMSSHVLSEQLYGYVYTLIFGQQEHMDFLAYAFWNTFLFYIIVYWFLNRLFKRPLLSLFFIFVFPFPEQFFYASVFISVLPLFFSRQLLEKPSPLVFFKVMLVIFLLLLWKLDSGVAALFASLVYFPVLWIVARKRFPFGAFVKGSALLAALLLILFLLASALRPPATILLHLKMAVHYFSANQAHGYRQILNNFNQQFYIYYVLFPFVAVALSLYIVVRLRKVQVGSLTGNSFFALSSLFLLLLFLANMQRGMVRHGFAEHGDTIVASTFFAAVALWIVFLLRSGNSYIRMGVFYSTSFFVFILLKFFPFQPSGTTLDAALTSNAIMKTGEAFNPLTYTGRTVPDTALENKTLELKRFLDKRLKPGQTFLDFSSTPMLYFYCQRPIPGYFNQNLQNTVDDFLQRELIKEVNPDKVPVVVFASYPRAWGDASDNIPNVTRYYLLAEYIFKNYKPYGVIGGRSIWLSNAFPAVPPASVTDTLMTAVDSADLNLLPEYTGLYFNNDKKKNTALHPLFQLKGSALTGSHDTLSIHLDSRVLNNKACYLEINFKTQQAFEPYPIYIGVADTVQNRLGIFSFIRRDWVSSRYLIRLSNHYFWYRHNQLDMQISPARDINQISVLNDLYFEN